MLGVSAIALRLWRADMRDHLDGFSSRVYTRFFASRVQWLYLALSTLHVLTQIALQLAALSQNLDAVHLLEHVVDASRSSVDPSPISAAVAVLNSLQWTWTRSLMLQSGMDASFGRAAIVPALVCDDDGDTCYWVRPGRTFTHAGDLQTVLDTWYVVEAQQNGVLNSTLSSPDNDKDDEAYGKQPGSTKFDAGLAGQMRAALRIELASPTTTDGNATATRLAAQENAKASSTAASLSPSAGKKFDDDHRHSDLAGDDDDDDDGPGRVDTDGDSDDRKSSAIILTSASRTLVTSRSITPGASSLSNTTKVLVSLKQALVYHSESNGVTVLGLKAAPATGIFVSTACANRLVWPVNVLHLTIRQDITFAFFFAWMLGLSLVALYCVSVPHVIAAIATHLFSTGWSIFQIIHTENLRQAFAAIQRQGECGRINLLPTYWTTRVRLETAMLVVSAVTLLALVFLSVKLTQILNWQTFERVGANARINSIYRAMLSLNIVLQLDLFFLIAFFALWLDQLGNGVAARLAVHKKIYQPLVGLLIGLLFPWLWLGIRSVRNEDNVQMIIFLAMSTIIVAAWSISFTSSVFRLTIMTWHFFTALAGISVGLTLITLALAVYARMRFGRGLTYYLDNDDAFVPELKGEEKAVGQPMGKPAALTFSKAFPELVKPARMFAPAEASRARPAPGPGRLQNLVRSFQSGKSWRQGDEAAMTGPK